MKHYVKTIIQDYTTKDGKHGNRATSEYLGTDYDGPIGPVEETAGSETWIDVFGTLREARAFIRDSADA